MTTKTARSRRGFLGHAAGAVAAAAIVHRCTDVRAKPSAVDDYRLVMACRDAANASPVWADVDRWCEDEAEALANLAATPGDLRDLLQKVCILADRQEAHWNLQDEEIDLLESMREQAEALLKS